MLIMYDTTVLTSSSTSIIGSKVCWIRLYYNSECHSLLSKCIFKPWWENFIGTVSDM